MKSTIQIIPLEATSKMQKMHVRIKYSQNHQNCQGCPYAIHDKK